MDPHRRERRGTLTGNVTNSGTFGVHNNTAVTIGGGFANSGTLGVDNAVAAFAGAITYAEGGSSLTVGDTSTTPRRCRSASRGVSGEGTYGLTAPTTVTLGLTNPGGASFVLEGSPGHAGPLAFSAGGSGFQQRGDFELTYAAPLSLVEFHQQRHLWGAQQHRGDDRRRLCQQRERSGVDNAVAAFAGAITCPEGGGRLTVGGTLDNTKAVQVGNVWCLAKATAPTADRADHGDPGRAHQPGRGSLVEGCGRPTRRLWRSAPSTGRFTSNAGDFELTYAAPLSLGGSFTNSGTFGVQTTAAVTIGGGFANSGTLGVDNAVAAFPGAITYAEGGSSLTVGGTLDNTNAVQVGSVVAFGEGTDTTA